jgi:hypothetical protein
MFTFTAGKVDAYIDCNRPSVPGGVARCGLSFSLEPVAHISVQASFRRALLPEWQKIRASVRDLLLSFRVKEVSEETGNTGPFSR